MVLNTDMMFHGKLLGILKTKVEVPQDLSTMDSNNLFNHQQDYLNNILHAADISNAAKPTNVYIKWAEKVINEFWQQGDLEKEKKLPISFLCDRETVTIAKSQIGFIDNVILPYFSAFNNSLNGKLSFLINYIEKNRLYYTKQKELDDMKNEI
jgi:hypothetical protein